MQSNLTINSYKSNLHIQTKQNTQSNKNKITFKGYLEEKFNETSKFDVYIKRVPAVTTFDDITDIEESRTALKHSLNAKKYSPQMLDKYKRNRVSPQSKTFIIGTPKHGKKELISAIVNETGTPLYEIKSDNILSNILGQTSQNFQNIIEQLKEKFLVTGEPSTILYDTTDEAANKNKAILSLLKEYFYNIERKNDGVDFVVLAKDSSDEYLKKLLSIFGGDVICLNEFRL